MKTVLDRLRRLPVFRIALPSRRRLAPLAGGRTVCVCLCLALLWGIPAPVSAQVPPDAGPAGVAAPAETALDDSQSRWETQSVRELMQQDLREALDASAHGSARHPGSGAATDVRPVLAPRLVALYGVGRALMAEVQVGRRAYLYVRGQAWPAGHAGDRGVYQLRGMNGACVQLERGEDRHSLCLRMLLGEGRP